MKERKKRRENVGVSLLVPALAGHGAQAEEEEDPMAGIVQEKLTSGPEEVEAAAAEGEGEVTP